MSISPVHDRHAQMTTKLDNYIGHSIDPSQYEQIKNRLKAALPPLERTKANNIMDIMESLEKKGTIAPGKYDYLKKIFSEFDVRIVNDIIVPAEDDIRSKTGQSTDPNAAGSSNDQTTQEPPNKKKRKTNEAEGIPHDDQYIYDTANKKGLLLIINFFKDRQGSSTDVDKLKDFFQENLNFEIEEEADQTKDKLIENLIEVRDGCLKGRFAKKYYCFICVVMGHGDKDGIKTDDDKRISMDEIISLFKNKETKDFLGKPKIFFVQSCRGSSIQSAVASDDITEVDIGQISVPHDADILVAHATTPGYKAYRSKYSEVGAWFIHVLLDVIKEKHSKEHLEEMLITIRHHLAFDERWRFDGSFCQMPCSWSTLTKRLYLR